MTTSWIFSCRTWRCRSSCFLKETSAERWLVVANRLHAPRSNGWVSVAVSVSWVEVATGTKLLFVFWFVRE